MTREEAIQKLVEKDVAKWGEGERAASERLRCALSHGRALNTLACYDPEHVDEQLLAEAKKHLTSADWDDLYQGG